MSAAQLPPSYLSPQKPGASRDLVLLDIALDDWFRTLTERMDLQRMSRDDLLQV